MLTTRRELCTRVMKRCRRVTGDQKTCASTCSTAACTLRDTTTTTTHNDLLCCQWPSLQSTPGAMSGMMSQPLNVTIYRSQRSRAQQNEMMTAWKAAMEKSDAIQRADATAKKMVTTNARVVAGSIQAELKECTLPMDMECGCKTKREKEAREALALAEAEAKKQKQAMEMQRVEKQKQEQAAAAAIASKTTRTTTTTLDVQIINSSAAQTQTQIVNGKPVEMQTSFHRRHLPMDCIAFSSNDGRKLFVEALNSPTNYMQIYFPLAEQFITQAEPAYCGLSTLAMCLNALQIDPGRLWKGAWRWFSEELFDCCTSLSVAKEKGISMSEFICLARCNGVQTDDHPADKNLSLEQFREIVKTSCTTSNEIVVLNYSRKVLGQTGDGHFSPIGGYHEERDMVLLLDVARFKYPPHWVKLSTVHAAMQRIDESSGLPRGLVVLKESAHATGPTLVKNMVLSADPSMPVKPAPQVCCSSPTSVESARHVIASANA